MSLAASPLDIVMPVTLEGLVVRLEPLRREHAEIFWRSLRTPSTISSNGFPTA